MEKIPNPMLVIHSFDQEGKTKICRIYFIMTNVIKNFHLTSERFWGKGPRKFVTMPVKLLESEGNFTIGRFLSQKAQGAFQLLDKVYYNDFKKKELLKLFDRFLLK